ncbi:MAG: heme-binding protein [Proteobacteria bacterium ST_bin13]|nr:MAG: heme-binding protein [Proteobacteria bacterium ST_bin13]
MKSLHFALMLGLSLLGACVVATEEPSFTVSLSKGECEVRDYPALVVAEVSVAGDRKEAASKGFRLLAGYIFGGNTTKQKIAMTAPVVQAPAGGEKIAMTAPVLQSGGDGKWVVRFIMPRGSTLETLPEPNNPKVHLQAIEPARMAVVRFSGLAQQSAIAANTDTLLGFMKAQQLHAIGSPALAQFDPPWTLWFLRRNEVMIPIARNESA